MVRLVNVSYMSRRMDVHLQCHHQLDTHGAVAQTGLPGTHRLPARLVKCPVGRLTRTFYTQQKRASFGIVFQGKVAYWRSTKVAVLRKAF